MSDAAAEAKAKGNDAFKAQKFEEAIEHFTAAISADPSGHVLYSNRSASYASLHQYDEALADADKCIALNGAWGKGYSRKGAALIGLGRLEDAIAAFEDGLKHEPDNASLRSGLEDARAKLEGGGGLGAIGNMFSDPALFGKLAANPQTMGFLKQPDFVAKINQLQRDPSSLSAHLQDPRIMQTLGMLMGVNVQSGADFAAEQADRPERKPPPPEPEPEPMEEDLSDEERAARAARKEADGHKEAGNAAYKAKRFDEAIGHYTKAAEVLPGEMTYLTNLAAVYFEQGEYRKSAETCADAVKVGRENRADYKNVAKAYARAGNALVKLDELEKAIKAYEDSMLENRTEDVEKRLKAAKRELQQRTAQAYLSDELAQVEKDRGNALFKEGKFVDAIGAYSEAMKRNPKDHVPYSNRAACYQKLMEWQLALKDCDKCIDMCPTFVKAHTRKGALHFHLKEYHKALDAYNCALKLDGTSDEARTGVERVIVAINSTNSEEDQQARAQRALQDPEIQAIVQDPTMRNVLSDMQNDPKSANKFLKDPTIKANVEKLIAAGVLSMK
ncbi:hypothetical protein KFE25_012768 [Diacronema lutheri]|uniref:STI1 domain-containing protein n=1 Tax=Diacronema lutheri TaxID=2081491 RepID=A0A8J6C831_DIALT|nr:hypothetical protein KFE25_012768 [Diacronema lutheri]